MGYNSSMSTVRNQVLQFVHTHQSVSASDIAMLLGTSRANARHHLVILEKQGFVEVIGTRQGEGRGRPSVLYGLSDRTKGDNLGTLMSALLSHSYLSINPEGRILFLEQLVETMVHAGVDGKPISRQDESISETLTKKLYRAIQILNQMNYHARWEAHADSPYIHFGNCPYSEIISRHPELCKLDSVLLTRLTGERVEQSAKLELDSRGLSFCAFDVKTS